ncbi:MAG TPA: response regulator, partial [Magnetospirillaceae bacterium]|nr:response regulator [Magnetospirillaceae bacterium]
MKFNVLIADDERNIREGMAEALRLDGYDVALAADGEEALRAVEAGRVDLVVTDLRMPKLSGSEV